MCNWGQMVAWEAACSMENLGGRGGWGGSNEGQLLGTRGLRRDSWSHYLLIKYFLGRLGSELIRRPSPKPSGQVQRGQDAPAPEPNQNYLCLHKATVGRAQQ